MKNIGDKYTFFPGDTMVQPNLVFSPIGSLRVPTRGGFLIFAYLQDILRVLVFHFNCFQVGILGQALLVARLFQRE